MGKTKIVGKQRTMKKSLTTSHWQVDSHLLGIRSTSLVVLTLEDKHHNSEIFFCPPALTPRHVIVWYGIFLGSV